MILSIIIVNYNVRHFLEQALSSVVKAISHFPAEIIVVDNASVDDSTDMVKKLFPNIKLIESKINLGFSKANNLALAQAKGKYILLLNPDTIVSESSLKRCVEFLDEHNDVGAVGVKMLDGSGNMLPESKRGFPSLWVSFCKMLGLHYIFPTSKLFNYYYMGHLNTNANAEVDVLTGAFFFTRKSILDKLGGLDEDYFMYGEDIDLSYRMQQMNYKNFYLADTEIIHYKGESTKKISFNYVSTFYKAMIIFAKKHLQGSSKQSIVFFLKAIIMLKGFMALIKTWIKTFSLGLIDVAVIFGGVFAVKNFWSSFYFKNANYYQNNLIWFNGILYTVIWIFSFYINGLYEKKFKTSALILSAVFGLMLNLVVYALLPESYRASRMILLLTFGWTLCYALLSRIIYNKLTWNQWAVGVDALKKILIIGNAEARNAVEQILNASQVEFEIVKEILPSQLNLNPKYWKDLVDVYKLDQIIFASPKEMQQQFNISFQDVIQYINLIPSHIEFKMMTDSKSGIIGSPSKKVQGELYTLDVRYKLLDKVAIRQKRFFDLVFSTLILCFSWLLIFLQKNKKQFIKNIILTWIGKKTWVSYNETMGKELQLPMLKKGVVNIPLEPSGLVEDELRKHIVINYASFYSVWIDLDYCLKSIHKLDQE